MHADALALAQHGLGVDGVGAEALAQQRGEAVEQLGVVADGGERGDQRDRAAVGRAAPQEPHAVALDREQLDDGAAQVVGARGEQLVLRERVEQRDRGLVVVRALDQVLVAQDLAQLAVEQRRLRRGLGVRLAREQPEHPRLAGDAAVVRDLAHPDVVHPHAPVHGRQPVGLGHDQQVALERALAHVRRQLGQRPRPRERRGRLVGQDAEPRAGHEPDRVVRDLVLAVAEEDEVVGEQPLEERDGLVDLVVRVARGARAGELHHPPAAVGHRREVHHRPAHVAEHRLDGVGERLEVLVAQPAVEVEVHHRLARGRLARVDDAGDATVRVALEPDDRMQRSLHGQPARGDRLADRVDEEREVLRRRLEHRAHALVAVGLGGRIERPHDDRPVAAAGGEVEHAADLGQQVRGRRLLGGVGRQAAQVRRRELPQRLRVPRSPLGDHRHQLLPHGGDRVLPRLDRDSHPVGIMPPHGPGGCVTLFAR